MRERIEMLPKTTYPRGYNPINPVLSWQYVRRLIRAARRGEKINPILVDDINDGNLLAGTHRLMANNIMEALGYDRRYLIPVYELCDIEDDELRARIIEAVEAEDYEDIDLLWDRRYDDDYGDPHISYVK